MPMGHVKWPKPPKGLATQRHAHGCVRCHRRYEDRCGVIDEDALCETCRTGRPIPFDYGQNEPAACCFDRAQPVGDAQVLGSFRLVGPGPWFKCSECARTFPHTRPKEKDQ